MSRGGARDNAGRKSGWVNVETKLIRVPVAIESQLMAIAKKLDQGEIIDLETKSIEIESVTESKLDSVTDSIKEIVDHYKKESDAATPKNTRWDNARKLLAELEVILYPERVIESVTEYKLEGKELVTDSESYNNDLVTESKVYEVEQFELIPSILQLSKLDPLSYSDLAIRLQVSERSIRNHKDDLPEWSKSKDPDGVAWERRKDKKYYPLNQ
jgi:hypothetical protein